MYGWTSPMRLGPKNIVQNFLIKIISAPHIGNEIAAGDSAVYMTWLDTDMTAESRTHPAVLQGWLILVVRVGPNSITQIMLYKIIF